MLLNDLKELGSAFEQRVYSKELNQGTFYGPKEKLQDLDAYFTEIEGILQEPMKGVGIVYAQDADLKSFFLSQVWEHYNNYLESLLKQTERRTQLDLPYYERMPAQKTMFALQEWCWRLTACWYGEKGANYSRIYKFWHACCEAAGLMAYRFEEITKVCEKTHQTRLNFQKRGEALASYAAQQAQKPARIPKEIKTGRSPIDNLGVSNVFTPGEKSELKLLLMRNKLKEAVIKLKAPLNRDKYKPLSEKTEKAIAEYVPESVALATEDEKKQTVEANVTHKALNKPSLFQAFTAFTRKYPGEYFKGTRETHLSTLVAGLWSNQLEIIPRETVESYNPYRYLAFNWQRHRNLYSWFPNQDHPTLQCSMGSTGSSRFRINEMPYGKSHGLSVAYNGQYEGPNNHGKAHFDWNTPQDPSAFLSNEYVLDIEKMVTDFMMLNPKGRAEDLLPGEAYFAVGQNPRNNSSIKTTQHFQVMEGCLADFALYSDTVNPIDCDWMGVSVDRVPVGQDRDACFYKFENQFPVPHALISGLSDLRMDLLKKFGGGAKMEFVLHCIPKTDGGFALIFTPFSQVDLVQDGNACALVNQRSNHSLPLSTKNGFGLFEAAGRDLEHLNVDVETLYDFLACPGVCEEMEKVLEIDFKFQRKRTYSR